MSCLRDLNEYILEEYKKIENYEYLSSPLLIPTALRQQAVFLIEKHMTKLPPEKKALRRWLGRLGEETIQKTLTLQEADMGSKGTGKPKTAEHFAQLRRLLEEILEENACLSLKDLAINGHDLMALGIRGKTIGRTLNALLELVMDEKLPNEKEALLQHIAAHRQEERL